MAACAAGGDEYEGGGQSIIPYSTLSLGVFGVGLKRGGGGKAVGGLLGVIPAEERGPRGMERIISRRSPIFASLRRGRQRVLA